MAEKSKSILEVLNEVQTTLIAPKDKKNSFGNYNYRNLEAILQAVKPILKSTGSSITFTDDIVAIAERIFCKSTATLFIPSGESIASVAFAELDTHKGMSKEQSTGSSSSYARKYAICSLLAIDDNTDIDSLDNTDRKPVATNQRTTATRPATTAPKQKKHITMAQFDKGECQALVTWLIGKASPTDESNWSKYLNILNDSYEFESGVLQEIDRAGRLEAVMQ